MEINQPDIKLLAITPNAEKLIEEAGRTCYMSLDRIAEDSEKNFIRNCIKSGHHSILEHPVATFRIKGASRAFAHQLVRHRLASYSQQSQRYVNESEFNYIVPPDISANKEAHTLYNNFIESTRRTYLALREMGIKKEDARFVLPNALESEIVFSANFRQLRHMLVLRGAPPAQWEIRRVFVEILRRLKMEVPLLVEDLKIDEERSAIVPVSIKRKEVISLKNSV